MVRRGRRRGRKKEGGRRGRKKEGGRRERRERKTKKKKMKGGDRREEGRKRKISEGEVRICAKISDSKCTFVCVLPTHSNPHQTKIPEV